MRERGDQACWTWWVRATAPAITRAARATAIVLTLLSAALPARADEFATLVSALGADSFAEKEQAITALGKLGDGRAVTVLTSLNDGRLLKAPDGRVLVSEATKLLDPLTGADAPDLKADALDRIRVNNRLRGTIQGALGGLILFSADPVARLAAAQDALRYPSADEAALLEKAMAHGEMIMLGAYAAYVCQQFFRAFLPPGWIDAYLVLAVPVAFLFAGAVGVVLERSVIRFLYGRPLETLLATWGVSLILQQAVRSMFGSPNKEVANPSWMTGGFDVVGGFMVTWNRLYIIVFCFVVLGALALILNRTRFGLHMRAVTQNRDMAAAMGIPTARIDALTFGLGSGIAGMAGVALSQVGNVSPNLGTIYIVDSFLVVVFGGVGNLMGTLVGSLSLGIVNKFLEPAAGAILGKIIILVAIILFIQLRPRGLFALKGRTAEA